MENIFIVLAIIGSVVYKIYTSYKEEMEKAAKRRQSVPPVPRSVPPQQGVPETSRRHTPVPTPPPVVSSKPMPVKKVPPVVPYEVPKEVKKVQQARVERDKKRIQQETEHQSVVENFQFDLRQAVIQSAILERPYK
ncbi:hypothetical protein G5B35_19670 [Parapusillimonas sp. SGNA-6]|uniref:hypothetical protein n=1 Tax=Parapedobacter sp. SGR-10 TaxID=2710879 RepID=UPI0013D16A42|nr:hypothetical protein [Parapedobacter sp. SGR-10]NGF56860.1 hypothetical protein [Parapedobacter sp. SGR-10]NGM89517.1 hypothetical protein [Parapusillimonas sp. SGNA-6]